MKPNMRLLAATVITALAPLASAQTAGPAPKIASNFTTLAGSPENALALVTALRNGTDVNHTPTVPPPEGSTEPPTTTTTTFTPPTGKMGWGNVKHSLALAQDALARAGVTNPTAEQLQTALVGGDLVITNADGTTTTSTLKGVLTMRAGGAGWGNIAKEGGTKLGHVPKVNMSATTGVTTAAGGDAVLAGKSKGVTTAAGVSATQSSKGITTASGSAGGHAPKGNAYGRGIVTATGGATVGVVTASGHGNNAGGNGKGNGKGGGKPGG